MIKAYLIETVEQAAAFDRDSTPAEPYASMKIIATRVASENKLPLVFYRNEKNEYDGWDNTYNNDPNADMSEFTKYIKGNKRVIELPGKLYEYLQSQKQNINGNVGIYLESVGDFMQDWEADHEGIPVTADDVANWYLGHIDFVEKEEPMYQVIADSVYKPDFERYVIKSKEGTIGFSHKSQSDDGFIRRFTEPEANELVAGLSALNPRKVLVND